MVSERCGKVAINARSVACEDLKQGRRVGQQLAPRAVPLHIHKGHGSSRSIQLPEANELDRVAVPRRHVPSLRRLALLVGSAAGPNQSCATTLHALVLRVDHLLLLHEAFERGYGGCDCIWQRRGRTWLCHGFFFFETE